MGHTWWELEVVVPEMVAEDAAAQLFDAGALGVEIACNGEGETIARASFGEKPDPRAVKTALLAMSINVDVAQMRIAKRDDEAWADKWKEHFEPFALGEVLWVVPSFRPDFRPPTNAIALHLDPGMAFGTGQHATTALCAQWLEQRMASVPDQSKHSVLDVGCGSGILSIAAAKLGAGEVVGIDNDPDAVIVAVENVVANGVADTVRVTVDPAAEVEGPFDTVVANILADTLISLSADLIRLTATTGRLALSGVLTDQAEEVVTAHLDNAKKLGRSNWCLLEQHAQGEWVALIFGASMS